MTIVFPEGIAGMWARPAAPEHGSARRYALADGGAYLLFAFDAANSGRRDLIHARIIGPRIRPFLIDEQPRLCVGVRFVPGFTRVAFGIAASDLLDQRVDYGLINAGADADLDNICSAETDAARVAGVLALAQRRFLPAAPVPASVRAALAHIILARGNIRVGLLADLIGISRQHLARQFATHVGMTAKQFARVKRAEAARAQAMEARSRRAGRVDWAMISHLVGYCDQAHLIRDFKAFTGSTPGRWIG